MLCEGTLVKGDCDGSDDQHEGRNIHKGKQKLLGNLGKLIKREWKIGKGKESLNRMHFSKVQRRDIVIYCFLCI